MMGYDSNYVPGWDCHGLPIEWKIEEEYRAKGKNKDAVPINEFRQECRAFAQKWLDIQSQEFQRLGVVGDWKNPYTTMAFAAEAQIARELMKFATSGQLYRGRVPGLPERYDLGEVPGDRLGPDYRDLDHHAMDHPRQPCHQLFEQDLLRALRSDHSTRRQLGEGGRQADHRR
jgi:hypothetical protein